MLTPPAARLPPTEARLEASLGLDDADSLAVLRLLNAEDAVAVRAVGSILPELARVVDLAIAGMRRGGRVHYFGAGTSGRLAVLDAAELLPTFHLEPGRVVAHIAGGADAVTRAVEDAEDSIDDGTAAAAGLGEHDLAIGLTASGSTPFVGAALRAARAAGAATVLVSCNPSSPFSHDVDIDIALETGPEVVTGSTRLKAGTAQKLVLNGFSTALMVGLGRTWSNLMVSVVATNEKLRRRSVRILAEATGIDERAAADALAAADGDLKAAIVAEALGIDAHAARGLVARADGSVRAALRSPHDA